MRIREMMKIDLHTHTSDSFDCELSVESVLARARKIGLNAIAITDHDTMSACGIARKAAGNLIIIPGMEITSTGGTHMIGLFLQEEVVSKDIIDIIDEIHEQRGLVLLPHPFRPKTGLVSNKEQRNLLDGEQLARILSRVDLIEAVNYRCDLEATINTDRFFSFYPDVPRVAGSDAHIDYEIGKAYVELEDVKSYSPDDIKDSLLFSPRTIRFEVYSDEAVREVKEARSDGKRKTLAFRTRSIIPAGFRRSIRTIYRRSAGRIISGRNKKFKMKVR
ncbi:MAG: PHP domain-containing protein [Candidatus Zixiibacteriota bacterium]|nr:MAG: PHP domain-containing protein [candidate division Zixibacteria bacterium]